MFIGACLIQIFCTTGVMDVAYTALFRLAIDNTWSSRLYVYMHRPICIPDFQVRAVYCVVLAFCCLAGRHRPTVLICDQKCNLIL